MLTRLKSDQCIVYSSLKHYVHKGCNPKPCIDQGDMATEGTN